MLRFLSVLLFTSVLQLVFVATAVAKEQNEQVVALPPESIGQWYKPQNKRQVWLHNMFKLRRELQAVTYYSSIDDIQHLEKWTYA